MKSPELVREERSWNPDQYFRGQEFEKLGQKGVANCLHAILSGHRFGAGHLSCAENEENAEKFSLKISVHLSCSYKVILSEIDPRGDRFTGLIGTGPNQVFQKG